MGIEDIEEPVREAPEEK
jgi:hypothetical protein